MLRSHKIRLEPDNVQASGLARAAGCARFAWNWGLAWWQSEYERYKAGEREKPPNQLEVRRVLNSLKREQFPWMLESTKCAPQEALINLGRAFDNFCSCRAKYPKFKKKGFKDSFKLSSGNFAVSGNRLRIPNVGWIMMSELPRFDGAIQTVTVSRRAGEWFAALTIDTTEPPKLPATGRTVGVDVGVREFVTQDGDLLQTPRALRKAERKLKRAQQALSRKQSGSANRAKARRRLANLHAKIADTRSDWIHKLTSKLVETYDSIAIENLNVRGMARNRHLAKSVLEAGFYEFRRQLEYKTALAGRTLVVAERWFASSKMCSACGAKTKQRMTLDVREWACKSCGTRHHRDVNAATNLDHLNTPGVPRCQPVESSPPLPTNGTVDGQAASVKQEPDSALNEVA
ncbi:RNA-guided endonuclease InsQ/TnpB family protein [Nocardia crassostreae]|uniref:RNA-guided endonuclease InsQ/TnpB family protein n=1 Tax=Nocardia crassostreae TaxID=53428 RepID=UPI000AA84692|nr:RNA-guided endonuclease TnpB family protein [Nocardia crassostreae]